MTEQTITFAEYKARQNELRAAAKTVYIETFNGREEVTGTGGWDRDWVNCGKENGGYGRSYRISEQTKLIITW